MDKEKYHGQLSIDSIVIKGDRAKLVNMQATCGLSDCEGFTLIMEGIFKVAQMPYNLRLLLQFLGDHDISEK